MSQIKNKNMELTTRSKVLIGVFVAILLVLAIVLPIVLISSDTDASSTVQASGIPPSSVERVGVAYDDGTLTPADHDDPVRRRDCIVNDFRVMKSKGYNLVRTYNPSYSRSCNGTDYAGVCAEVGDIQVLLGVSTSDWEERKQCIFDQVNKNPDQVFAVAIGNEDVQDGNWSVAATILAQAKEYRAAVAGLGSRMPPVGTAQRAGFSLCAFTSEDCNEACPDECKIAYQNLRSELDFIGSNIYPGSPGGGPPIASSDSNFNITSVLAQSNPLEIALGNQFVITETGMPWKGTCRSANGDLQTYTRDLQTQLVDDILDWRETTDNTPVFIFMGFDVPSKSDIGGCDSVPDSGGSGEKFFGVIDSSQQSCKRIP